MNRLIKVLIRIRYYLLYLFRYHRYGKVGTDSFVGKALRLVNPKHIFIGSGVSIMPMGRMECVRRNGASPLEGRIQIGDGTSIEQCCHIIAGDDLQIGRDVTISAFVYIADCGHGIDDVETDVMDQPLEVKKTRIEDGAFIGIGARIMPGVTVGKHAIVGANAVVNKDVADYTMVAGVPAKVIKTYNFEKKEWVR